MQKIRILHIIKTLNLGGAEANLINLAQAIDSNQFEIHVGYSSRGELEGRFRESGIKLFKFSQGDHKIKSLASLAIILRLVKYILKNKIQIVQTHSFNAHVWALIAAKLTGVKIIEHVHDFRYLEPVEFKRRRGTATQYKYIKYFKNMSDIVIVLTKQNYDFLLNNRFYDKNQVRRIQNGMFIPDKAEFNIEARISLKRKLNIGDDDLVIMTSCRIAAEKNIDLVFRIALKIKNKYERAVFVIAGDGPLLGEFKERIKTEGMENTIRMVGFYDKTNDLLGISDLFLLPSFLELHSIAVLEAMKAKVPLVISKDVGCNNEFITNWQNGVLLDPFVDEGWAEAIIRLLKDSELRKKIGENGYKYCTENFNIKDVAGKIENIYRELTNKTA
jgi:glycosyltransferase involved in cell wall biosynthesis